MQANSSEIVQEVMDRVSEFDILYHYFGIKFVPAVVNSPLRKDSNPSFGVFSPDGKKVYYHDFATGEHGDVYKLMQKYYHRSFIDIIYKINRDIGKFIKLGNFGCCDSKSNNNKVSVLPKGKSDIRVKIREWQDYDIDYWKSYGISLKWLKYAEVYPVGYKIVYKDDARYVFKADKYAYVFVERKERKTTLKVYQPFNKKGFKWSNKNDKSVVGLWTKIPETGDKLVICSSLKDALCLWSNTFIPCIYVQSETTDLSETAKNILRKRFSNIYILFDNDEPGLIDGENLSRKTGFTNIVLPKFIGGKDISDLYKTVGKKNFLQIVLPLLNIDSTQLEDNKLIS